MSNRMSMYGEPPKPTSLPLKKQRPLSVAFFKSGQQPNVEQYPSPNPTPDYPKQQQQKTICPPAWRLPAAAFQQENNVIANDTLRISLLSTAEDKVKRRVKETFQMGQVCFSKLPSDELSL